MFVAKVAELLKQRSLQPNLPIIKRSASEGWKKLFSTTESPDLNFEAIEYITSKTIKKEALSIQIKR